MKKYLPDILFIAVVVLMTLQISSWFRRTPPNEKLIRSEMQIETLQRKIKDDSLVMRETRLMFDSLLILSFNRFDEIEAKKQPIKYAIKQSNAAVDNFDKEQLRNASTEHFEKYK